MWWFKRKAQTKRGTRTYNNPLFNNPYNGAFTQNLRNLNRIRTQAMSKFNVKPTDRVTGTRTPGCGLRVLRFSGRTAGTEAAPYIYTSCGKDTPAVEPGFIKNALRAMKTQFSHIWVAFSAGESVGYVMAEDIVVGGLPGLHIHIVCTRNTSRSMSCTNLGVHLMRTVEAFARLHGSRFITLDSTDHAIRFYARLGYELTRYPCPTQAKQRQNDNTRIQQAFIRRALQHIREGKRAHMSMVTSTNTGTVPMAKCLT